MVTSSNHKSKDAITYLETIDNYQNFALIKCTLETGRTHQIRVHLLHINNPVINDPIYSKNKKTTKYGQYLMANKIEFYDPFKKENRVVEIPMENEFKKYIEENL